MKISELGSKAVINNLWGKISYIGEVKDVKGEHSTFHTQFIALKEVEGKIINPVTEEEIQIQDDNIGISLIVSKSKGIFLTEENKGQTLSLEDLTINDYEKDGEPQRNLKGKLLHSPSVEKPKEDVQKTSSEKILFERMGEVLTNIEEMSGLLLYRSV